MYVYVVWNCKIGIVPKVLLFKFCSFYTSTATVYFHFRHCLLALSTSGTYCTYFQCRHLHCLLRHLHLAPPLSTSATVYLPLSTSYFATVYLPLSTSGHCLLLYFCHVICQCSTLYKKSINNLVYLRKYEPEFDKLNQKKS